MSYVFKNVRQHLFCRGCKSVLYKKLKQAYSKLLFSIFSDLNIQFLLKRYFVEFIRMGNLLPPKRILR